MYIKINGSDTQYGADLMPFKTQHGNDAVRVLNGMPQTDKGFKVYKDNGNVFADYSTFIYPYGDGEGAYTAVQETIQPAECSYVELPPSQLDKLSSRVSRLSSITNANVNSINELDDALCEYSTDIDERVGMVEDALCELSEDTEEIEEE